MGTPKLNEYYVLFDVSGKKLKVRVEATDEIHAVDIVKSSITVHKVFKAPEIKPEQAKPKKIKIEDLFNEMNWDDILNNFGDFLGGVKKKK